jgi:hypothetical protein
MAKQNSIDAPTPFGLNKGGTGANLTDPGADRLLFWDDSANAVTWLETGTGLSITGTVINASGGSGSAVTQSVTQTTHGLAVGDVIRLNGTSYIKAQANSAANAEAVGIVNAVADTNNFTFTTDGLITGLSSLTAGSVYFLSAATAGLLTATAPSTAGQIRKAMLVATTTTAGIIVNYIGVEVGNSIANGNALVNEITQTAHGLAVGDVVRLNGTSYTKAQANTVTNAEAVGIVSAVPGANNFTFVTEGKITGLSGLTAGSVYFLSAATAGLLTATAPSTAGQINKPMLVADTTTSGYVVNYRGNVVPSSGGTGVVAAWVNFDGTATVAIREAYNVSSITDNNTGDYTANFTNALSSANYAISGSYEGNTSPGAFFPGASSTGSTPTLVSTTQCRMKTTGPTDAKWISLVINQ